MLQFLYLLWNGVHPLVMPKNLSGHFLQKNSNANWNIFKNIASFRKALILHKFSKVTLLLHKPPFYDFACND